MKKLVIVLAIGIASVTTANADNIRCSSGIASTGDHYSSLLAKCGQPLDKTVRDNLSGDRNGFDTKRIEEWTYVTDGMIRLVTVINGKIVKIQTTGRSN